MPFGLFTNSYPHVRRCYAIGDIHGRIDLFERLISIIKRDSLARGDASSRIILLGDIIDHGPDSCRLVQYCRILTERTDRFVMLKGDHEDMMVAALRDGGMSAIDRWFDHGAAATLASWGVAARSISHGDREAIIAEARDIIDPDLIDWLDSLPLTIRHDDHLFVHAGIRPGIALRDQSAHDLITIRKGFLESDADHGVTVVHGHSIYEAGPDWRANRIGIDTGAYRTGRLTALGVEEGDAWPLSTDPRSRSRKPDADQVADLIAGLQPLHRGTERR